MACLAVGGLSAGGCGSEGGGGSDAPKPPGEIEIRQFYGLTAGSCWSYAVPGRGLRQTREVQVDEASWPGHRLFRESVRSGASNVTEDHLFEVEDGQVLLRRVVTGSGADRTVYRYEDADAPVFLAFEAGETPAWATGARFETEVSPMVCAVATGACETGPTERHRWVVIDGAYEVETTRGTEVGADLRYEVSGGRTLERRYVMVPGFGIALAMDATGGDAYEVCAAELCDDAGSCEGSCDASQCSL